MNDRPEDTIIYVDDDLFNLKAVERLFRNEPFDFITYDSPVNALNEIKETRPAVIISDQCMPKMNGIEFLLKAKSEQPETVGIILTGHADLESAMTAINKGHVYGYVGKPWNDDEFTAQVNAALKHYHSISWLNELPDLLADEAVQNPKKGKAVQKLTEAVGYELSQPLTIISGYAQLLKNSVKDDDIHHLYISHILFHLNKIDALRNTVNTIAKRVANQNLSSENRNKNHHQR
ncbi:hypothetical protein DSCO28_34660 [Desulfosarcina ovata subsp. sediminis]|uniref:histidine kinase n=1 Tax=Desulfosarcina ovata subsp. sediminis TaxID=885957 RepID=A0A5K7ZR77_9BACT|nr:response regulator [Desulfosarcina ovata]BBO82900.1 hypothetical protein DSCO28_34660 [Desulfosarcina ovata subsp. sediminis]